MKPVERWLPAIFLGLMCLVGSIGFPKTLLLDSTIGNVLVGALISAVVAFATAGWTAARELRRDERARMDDRKSKAAVVSTQLASILGYEHAIWFSIDQQMKMKDSKGEEMAPWQKVRSMVGAPMPPRIDALNFAFLLLAGRSELLGEIIIVQDRALGIFDLTTMYSGLRQKLVEALPVGVGADPVEIGREYSRLRPRMNELDGLALELQRLLPTDTLETIKAIRHFRDACRAIFGDPYFLPYDEAALRKLEDHIRSTTANPSAGS